MDEDFPELQWKDNIEKSEGRIMDKNVWTFFFFFEKPNAEPEFNSFIDWVKKKSMTVKDSEHKYEISSRDKTIATAETWEDCIVFRISKDDVMTPYFDMIRDYFEERFVDTAVVRHGEDEFPIHGTKVVAKSWTWCCNLSDAIILPKTLFKFYLGKKLIAKMYMLYTDFEMDETGPTVSKFEVAAGMKGKGYGKKIIHTIEERLMNQGFAKLWLEDTKSVGFWRKMGYEIDIDEGWKYLLP